MAKSQSHQAGRTIVDRIIERIQAGWGQLDSCQKLNPDELTALKSWLQITPKPTRLRDSVSSNSLAGDRLRFNEICQWQQATGKTYDDTLIDQLWQVVTFNDVATVDHKQLEVAIKQSVNGDEAKPYCFWPDGDGYYIEAFGESGHFKARGGKGFHDIYRLVQSPNVPVKMATLQGFENEESLSIDDAVDPRAKRELESRMRSLAKDIESAENEFEKRELQSEFQQLADYQKSSIGKAGKSRDLNSRQRTNWRTGIIDRIRNARKKLQDASPPMLRTARHLEECICAEGDSFVYRLPEPPNWQFDCQKNQ